MDWTAAFLALVGFYAFILALYGLAFLCHWVQRRYGELSAMFFFATCMALIGAVLAGVAHAG